MLLFEGTCGDGDRQRRSDFAAQGPRRRALRHGGQRSTTALRKFDGIDEPAAASAGGVRPTRFGWASAHRRPIGALVTAAVVAAISIPVALVTLRDLPQAADAPPQMPPAAVQPAQPAPAEQAPPAFDPSQKAEDVAAAEPLPAPTELAPAAPPARRNAMTIRSEEQKAIAETAAPLVAAPAPPPPPPAAPPAPAPQYATESNAADMVVTGSRIRAPAAKQGRAETVSDRVAELVSEEDSAQFLSRLQSALRSNDRQGLKGLIAFPLVVRLDGRVEIYRTWREVDRDYDQIFTPRVRRSVLDLQADEVVGRSESGTMGTAMLRFSPSCANRACSKAGPIRVREVNP